MAEQQPCVSLLSSHDESEKRLPKSCLVVLCKYEPVLRWSRDCDNSLYQALVEILIPDVLRPIPSKTMLAPTGLRSRPHFHFSNPDLTAKL